MSQGTVGDLYDQVELHGKISVPCSSKAEFLSLRTSIYRARKKLLEAFAQIDEVDDDGKALSVTFDEGTGIATLELKTKASKKIWTFITPDTDG